jgi:hypothetical protein
VTARTARWARRIGPQAAVGYAVGVVTGLVFAVAALLVLGAGTALVALLLLGVAVSVLGIAAVLIRFGQAADAEPLPDLVERALAGRRGERVGQ